MGRSVCEVVLVSGWIRFGKTKAGSRVREDLGCSLSGRAQGDADKDLTRCGQSLAEPG